MAGQARALQWVSPGISCIDQTRSAAERPFFHKELVSISMEMHSLSFPLLLIQSMSQSSCAVWGSQSFTRFQLASLSLYFSSGDLVHSKKNCTSDWLNVVLFLANEHLGTMSEKEWFLWGFRSKKEYREDTSKVNNPQWCVDRPPLHCADPGDTILLKEDRNTTMTKQELCLPNFLRPQSLNLASSFGQQARKDSQLAPRQEKGKELASRV